MTEQHPGRGPLQLIFLRNPTRKLVFLCCCRLRYSMVALAQAWNLEPAMTDSQTLPLSIVDRGCIGSQPLDVILRYLRPLDTERVCDAFWRALGRYNLLAGTFATDERNEICLRLQPDGSQLTVERPLDDVIPAVWSESEEWLERLRANVDRNALGVRITPTPSGTFLAISASHVAVDAFSLVMFVHAWNSFCRGAQVVPHCERRFACDLIGLDAAQGASTKATRARVKRQRVDGARDAMEISASDLAALVAECQRHCAQVSAHSALTAYLLKRYAKELVSSESRVIRLRTALDLRGLAPGVPLDYFGNAFVDAVATFDAETLQATSVAAVAEQISLSVFRVGRAARAGRIVKHAGNLLVAAEDWSEYVSPFEPETDVVCSTLMNLVAGSELLPDFGTVPPGQLHLGFASPRGFLLTPLEDGAVRVRIHRMSATGST